MTRILTKTVECPSCGHVQKAQIVFSWNEHLSGPMPRDALAATCDACRHEFDPLPAEVAEPPPSEPTRSWWRRLLRW